MLPTPTHVPSTEARESTRHPPLPSLLSSPAESQAECSSRGLASIFRDKESQVLEKCLIRVSKPFLLTPSTPTPASLPGPSQAVSTPGRPSFPTQPGTCCLLTRTWSKPATSEQGGRVPFPHPQPLNTHWLHWKHCLQHPECHPNPSLCGLQGWRDHTQQDMHPPDTLGPQPSQASHRHPPHALHPSALLRGTLLPPPWMQTTLPRTWCP